jgi:hypothetical protein
MTEAVETQEAPQLSLQDIATSVQIVDICSRRGAFEGTELEAVGGLRSRLVAFIEANREQGAPTPDGEVPAVEAEAVGSDSDESDDS